MLIFNYILHNRTQFLCTLKKFNKAFPFPVTFNSKICDRHYTNCKSPDPVSQNGPRKVLFFGTGEFAVESLKVLNNKYKCKILQRLEIVTSDKNPESAVIKYANKNKLAVNKWPIEVNKNEFDIGIVVSFGHLIPSKIINAFPLGMLNVHASLLPRWRGAAPITYTLINGDSETGVTLMKIMPKKFDIGEIIIQKRIDINEHETMPELYKKLAKLGADLIDEMFENFPQLLQSAKPQDERNVTYAPKITPKIALINWKEMSAENVYNLHRALLELYPLTTSFENLRVKLFDIQKIKSETTSKRLEGEVPGVVIYDRRNKVLIIKCKEESFISVKRIIIQGKRPMSALDFYNGFMSGKYKTKIAFS